MNVVFWLLVVIALVLLWFVLAFTFKPIGSFFTRLWNDALDAMEDDEEKEN